MKFLSFFLKLHLNINVICSNIAITSSKIVTNTIHCGQPNAKNSSDMLNNFHKKYKRVTNKVVLYLF